MVQNSLTTSKPIDQSFILSNATIVQGAHLPILSGGSLAVENGKIIGVGSTQNISKLYPHLPVIDAKDHIVMPGLFNSHTHVPMGFFRGLGHGKVNMIESFLFPAEAKLTPELLKPLSYSYIAEGMRSGVTSFADHYYFSDGIAQAFETLGARAWIGETIADLGGAFPGEDSFDRAKLQIEKSKHSSRIKYVIAPHATDTVSKSLLTKACTFAKSNALPIHMHLAQTPGENERVRKRENSSPVEFAKSCNALGPTSLVVHLTNTSESDLSIISDSGSTIGWCPGSTVIYDKLAPVKEIFDRDIPLAIGTDCAASNDSCDILQELRTAYLFAKHSKVPMEKLSTDSLLSMATTQPAKVLGAKDTLGTLEVGKIADFAVLKKSLSSEPIENVIANIIFSMGAKDVTHLVIDGKWQIWNREFVSVNENDLKLEYLNSVKEITRRVQAK